VLVERILVNLLENAEKYTPANTPIRLAAAATSDTVELWLDDYGPGLPPGREEAIFNKFERGRKESAIPGVGLGLALCRAIAQAHGGRMQGATRPDGGARFTLTLPRGEPPQVPAENEPTTDGEQL
jgi:two-component system sensor histidine kinase KdpD